MKILHICTGYPLSYQGGITNYVRMLAQEQLQMGIDVTVMGGEDNNINEYNFKYYSYYSETIKPFSFNIADDIAGLEKLKDFLEENQFDLIHIHMMLDIDIKVTNILKKYKYIVSLHDYFYLCPRIIMMGKDNTLCTCLILDKCRTCITKLEMVDFFRNLDSKYNRLTNKNLPYPKIKQNKTDVRYKYFSELLENAQMLLPVSTRVKQIYIESGIENEYKVLHIGNYTAENYTNFLEQEVYKNNSAKINVTILGALTYHKGAEVLLYLMNNIQKQNINFNFYGRADNHYLEKFIKLGGIYHGTYSQKDLSQILKKSDLGLVLSVWEDNAPQVVMEFLNNNVPILGTKMGGITDFVNENNGFIFNPYSQEELDKAVQFLNYLNKDIIVGLKKNIKRTKTPKEHIDELYVLYKELI